MSGRYTILAGDSIAMMRTLPEASVHAIITSPPYWSLRDYGFDGQIGLEPTFSCWGWATHLRAVQDGFPDDRIDMRLCGECHTCVMIQVFREARRVAHPSATLWLDYGDRANGYDKNRISTGRFAHVADRPTRGRGLAVPALKNQDLLLMGHTVAMALRSDGWFLRSDVIWHKPDPLTESVQHRPVRCHEDIFYFSVSDRGLFYDADAVREPYASASEARMRYGRQDTGERTGMHRPGAGRKPKNGLQLDANPIGRLRRDVWKQSTGNFYGDHTATYPPELVEPCVLASASSGGCCPECKAPRNRIVEKGDRLEAVQRAAGGDANGRYNGQSVKDYAKSGAQEPRAVKQRTLDSMVERITKGWDPICECGVDDTEPCVVLDPFAGMMSTGIAALKHGRRFIGIEGSEKAAQEGRERLERQLREWEHGAKARTEHEHSLMAGQGRLFDAPD